jgi:hypothetical protein
MHHSGLGCRRKSDLAARRFRRRREKWQQLLINIAQSRVLLQQRFVDLSETLQDCSICRNVFTQFDKRANHIDTHRDGAIAPQYVRRLLCAVFGECAWPIPNVPDAVAICDRIISVSRDPVTICDRIRSYSSAAKKQSPLGNGAYYAAKLDSKRLS